MRAADGANWGGGWVGAEQRALRSGAGVPGGSCWNREGCAQRMGRIGVADGSERDNAPSDRGRGYVGSVAGIGRGAHSGWVEAEQRMGQVGVADGSERDNAP